MTYTVAGITYNSEPEQDIKRKLLSLYDGDEVVTVRDKGKVIEKLLLEDLFNGTE